MTSGTSTSIRWATKAAQRGYTIAQNIVLFDDRLPAPARLLYVQLAHYAWRNPDTFPTQEEIASNLGVTDRQVRRYAATLEERWLLERHQRGLGRAVEYVLYEPPPDYLERDARDRTEPRLRPVENAVETPGDVDPSPDIGVRASPDMSVRLARTPASEPSLLPEGSEDLQEQEPIRLVVGRSVTREEHQRIADTVDNSLRRGGLQQ